MILQRYLIKEILLPLVLWVGFLFLLLLVMQFLRGTDTLLGSGVRARDLALLMFYMSPHFLVMALPVALLLGILLGLGRLSEDREIAALQACGISPFQILRVPVSLGVLICALMLALTWSAEPWGLSSLQRVIEQVVKRNVMGDVKPGLFHEGLSRLTLYAEKVDPDTHAWENVLVHDEQNAGAPVLVLARRGHINPKASKQELKLVLDDGEAHKSNAVTANYQVVDFDTAEVAVWLGDALWRGNRGNSPYEAMTPAELQRAAEDAPSRGEDPMQYIVALHGRLGRTVSPLAFAFIAAPLAILGGKSRRGRGFALTLSAYVGYYVLARMFESWAVSGRLPPAVAAQLPNVLFVGAGAFAFFRLGRHGERR
ncbi:MAG: LPS export ABC transporter permease LptF [Myxococcaceae bacterium]